MTKKRTCDVCNKDFNEGTGSETKTKFMVSKLWKIGDLCGTCTREKLLLIFKDVPWRKYDSESKQFLEYTGTVPEV